VKGEHSALDFSRFEHTVGKRERDRVYVALCSSESKFREVIIKSLAGQKGEREKKAVKVLRQVRIYGYFLVSVKDS
jgi:hypothetical protein